MSSSLKLTDSLLAVAGGTLLHAVLLFITKQCVDPSLPTTGGSPRHAYLQGAIVQLLLAPLLATGFFWWERRHRGGLRGWMRQSLAAPDTLLSRLFFYNIVAHFCKDFLEPMDTLIAVHHVACTLVLFAQVHAIHLGGNACMMGCALFELGSATYNIHHLYPTSQLGARVYVITMLASNIGAAFAAANWAWLPHKSLALRIFGATITLVLVVVRQQIALGAVPVAFDDAVLAS